MTERVNFLVPKFNVAAVPSYTTLTHYITDMDLGEDSDSHLFISTVIILLQNIAIAHVFKITDTHHFG